MTIQEAALVKFGGMTIMGPSTPPDDERFGTGTDTGTAVLDPLLAIGLMS
jgi:hypothetical protein